tara:strand:- start:2514 stop:3035 length:522 start_codon:yes stop_codon:yes gene_type:complete
MQEMVLGGRSKLRSTGSGVLPSLSGLIHGGQESGEAILVPVFEHQVLLFVHLLHHPLHHVQPVLHVLHHLTTAGTHSTHLALTHLVPIDTPRAIRAAPRATWHPAAHHSMHGLHLIAHHLHVLHHLGVSTFAMQFLCLFDLAVHFLESLLVMFGGVTSLLRLDSWRHQCEQSN